MSVYMFDPVHYLSLRSSCLCQYGCIRKSYNQIKIKQCVLPVLMCLTNILCIISWIIILHQLSMFQIVHNLGLISF